MGIESSAIAHVPVKGGSSLGSTAKSTLTKRFLLIFICLSLVPISMPAKETGALQIHGERNFLEGDKSLFMTMEIVDGQLFMTIAEEVLGQPVLFVRYDKGSSRRFLQVVWSIEGNRMVLKVPSIRSTAGVTIPINPRMPREDIILAVVPFERTRENHGYTMDITDLVLHQMIEWEPGFSEHLVPEVSLLMGVRNLGDEVIIKTRRGLLKGESKVAVPIYYGFCRLPDPMRPRRFDYRMGFYDEEVTNLHFLLRNSRANITKCRLEKRFKDQAISIPLDPITFLMSPDIPKKWRPYVKAGIEEWLPAFEAAGFRDALVVKEVDSLDEWQVHSIHSNMVHWSRINDVRGHEDEEYAGSVANVIDLRTGEILRGDILLQASEHSLMEKYFVRAAPLDKRAQKFPFPDELTGSLIQVLTAHEAGHIFGLKDGNYGEYAYPWEKMNDSLWLKTMGHTPSIMNYTRSSNIPQPEDNVPPDLLVQKVGPTDKYSIQWAYTEFPEGTTPEEESRALEQMIRWQDTVPWYRFSNTTFETLGPSNSDEVVETNDPLKSTPLGLKNLSRVISLLPKVTNDQSDNARLERLYGKTLALWNDHMGHVLSLIGGYDIQYKPLRQSGNLYTPIAWEKQQEALDFLLTNAFAPPEWLTRPSFMAKTKYSSFPDQVMQYQQRLLQEMIMAPRLNRLTYLESRPGNEGVVETYLSRLRLGLFSELRKEHEALDRRGQGIQVLFIEQMIKILDQESPGLDKEQQFFAHSDYVKSLVMHQLMALKKDIESGMAKDLEDPSSGHWQRCLRKLNGI